MNMACLSLQCFSLSILSDLNLTTTALLYLIGSTLCLIVLSPYFSAVLPSEYGVRKSPFFPIIGEFTNFERMHHDYFTPDDYIL